MLAHYSHIRTAAKRAALENMRNLANDAAKLDSAPDNGEPGALPSGLMSTH
jgi:hypothetical protein